MHAYIVTRYRPRFFDQVGHQTMYAYIRNKHFLRNHDIVRPTRIQNYKQPQCMIAKFLLSKSSSASKINGIFLILFSVKSIKLGDQLSKIKFFENFDF